MTKPFGEFELIDRLSRRLRLSARTILGPGDDCAIIARPRARHELLTIDSMVEEVHFKYGWFSARPEALGERALTVNLSDIAAMGGAPAACLVNLAVREGLTMGFFERLYEGLQTAAGAAQVDIVGGNVTSAKALAITIALVGDAPARPLRRDGAKPGDDIFVTGTIGDAACGWRILGGELRARGTTRDFLTGRFRTPTARIEAGRRLAAMKSASAAIDVSDGLMQDLGHIVKRSGVGAEIDANTVPVSPAYRALMSTDLGLALRGGEDYELLFCMRAGRSEHALTTRLGVPVTRIGRITASGRVEVRGASAAVGRGGWDQMLSDSRRRHGGR